MKEILYYKKKCLGKKFFWKIIFNIFFCWRMKDVHLILSIFVFVLWKILNCLFVVLLYSSQLIWYRIHNINVFKWERYILEYIARFVSSNRHKSIFILFSDFLFTVSKNRLSPFLCNIFQVSSTNILRVLFIEILGKKCNIFMDKDTIQIVCFDERILGPCKINYLVLRYWL